MDANERVLCKSYNPIQRLLNTDADVKITSPVKQAGKKLVKGVVGSPLSGIGNKTVRILSRQCARLSTTLYFVPALPLYDGHKLEPATKLSIKHLNIWGFYNALGDV